MRKFEKAKFEEAGVSVAHVLQQRAASSTQGAMATPAKFEPFSGHEDKVYRPCGPSIHAWSSRMRMPRSRASAHEILASSNFLMI